MIVLIVMQADYSHSSFTCPWLVVTWTDSRVRHRTCESQWSSPYAEATHCQHAKLSGPEDVKSTQIYPWDKLSFPCPSLSRLVCLPSLKWHNINVKKANFGEWGGGGEGCELRSPLWGALDTQLPSLSTFCVSWRQVNSLQGDIELLCLGFMLIPYSLMLVWFWRSG